MMSVAGIIGGAAGAAAQSAPQGSSSGPLSATTGASHDIVIRMSVPASCRMSSTAPQIRLTGKTDDGGDIDTTLSGQGGLVVDCNTPYSMSLARTFVYDAPRPSTGPVRTLRVKNDRAPTAQETQVAGVGAAALADAVEQAALAREPALIGGDMDVLVRVDGRGGAMESSCVMAAAGDTPFVCHAFAGPDDARLPPPRATASLIVTGTLSRVGQLVAPVTMPSARSDAALDDAQRRDVAANDNGSTAVVRLARDRALDVARDRAIGQATGRRIGDRLTVSLTARY